MAGLDWLMLLVEERFLRLSSTFAHYERGRSFRWVDEMAWNCFGMNGHQGYTSIKLVNPWKVNRFLLDTRLLYERFVDLIRLR